jgi:hypothetical protein
MIMVSGFSILYSIYQNVFPFPFPLFHWASQRLPCGTYSHSINKYCVFTHFTIGSHE